MLAVTNFPSGCQRSVSSTNIFPLASFTNLVAQGSGTPAPSISYFKNSVNMVGLSIDTTVTFPPFSVVLNPLSNRYFRNTTSWVLPSWGDANFLLPKSFIDFIPASLLTTKATPPLEAPEIIRTSFPSETIYPFIAGSGPTYATSILFANSASIADGPELNTNGCIFILSPKIFWNWPLFRPMTAWAWLIFGK